jgi:hypothetical protein
MTSRRLVAAACAASFLTVWLSHAGPARADEVRYYEKNGVTWCETRRTVQERVPESRIEDQTETVYREEFTTELQETTRTRWTPVTEYRWEAFWAGRWNPFAGPYLAYRYVPRTHWEPQTETVKVPVNTRRLVPETRTVRRPVGGFRVVEREVVSRVPVGGTRVPAGTALASQPLAPVEAPAVAARPEIGGVWRMHNDPPRYGTATAWRASSDTLR